MKFSLWTNYGALNSGAVFKAFEESLINAGHEVVHNSYTANVAVIWSVLEHGRMAPNAQVWQKFQGRPVIVLEVGGINRDVTWKVGLGGVNREAYFGPTGNNHDRAKELKIKLAPWRKDGEYILICGQHDKSRQWIGMPSMTQWMINNITEIRKHTDRPIVIRPHPRCKLLIDVKDYKDVRLQNPKKVQGTYDGFDLEFDNAWATVNWSSNPGIHSILAGVPAFVGPHSLAYDVANHDLSNIEDPVMPDREQWRNDYAWTEYTVEEIQAGIPLKRLTDKL